MAQVLEFQHPEPSSRELMARALDPYILLGMPHLTPMGLSETWLMKELGHRHWLMLARSMGLNDAGFKSASGGDVYAAICATSLRNGALNLAKANDVMCVGSSIMPTSRTQVSSHHRVSVGNSLVADVELVSTFVRHAVKGDNHSIAKIDIGGLLNKPSCRSELAIAGAQIRGGSINSYLELPVGAHEPVLTFEFKPSGKQEFNGAGLLYFAEFQAICDRALAHWCADKPLAAPVRRDVFFSGNIREGESLTIELVSARFATSRRSLILRRADGQVVGRIFTLQ